MLLNKHFAYFLIIIFKIGCEFQTAFGADDQPQVTCSSIGNRKIDVSVNTNLKADIKNLMHQYAKKNSEEIARQQEKQTEELQKLRNELTRQFENFQKEIVKMISNSIGTTKALQPLVNSKNYDAHFNCVADCGTAKYLPDSCEQAMASGDSTSSGLYLLNIPDSGALKPFYALCERFDGQAWTIIQNRANGAVNFTRNWADYQQGFGNLAIGEDFWLGLERLHALTTKHQHELLIRMRNRDGIGRYARYSIFKIGSAAEKYKLTIGGYRGTAIDAMEKHNGMQFSTYDRDNDLDARNCARTYEGGWWFNNCHDSHLNGPFDLNNSIGASNGMAWRFSNTFLQFSKMAIRRTVEPNQETNQFHCNCAANKQELKELVCTV